MLVVSQEVLVASYAAVVFSSGFWFMGRGRGIGDIRQGGNFMGFILEFVVAEA